jgi:predicted RecA/RadA family phage recombinase
MLESIQAPSITHALGIELALPSCMKTTTKGFSACLAAILLLACGSLPTATKKSPSESSEDDASGSSTPGASGATTPSASAPTAPGSAPSLSEPVFTLSFSNAGNISTGSTEVLTNGAITTQVFVRSSNGFDDPVAITVSSGGAPVAAALSPASPVSASSFTVTLPGISSAGSRSFTIRGQAGSLSSEVTFNVTISAPAAGTAVVSSMTLAGRSSKDAKQGYGDEKALTLVINGSSLDTINTVELRQESLSISCKSLSTGSATQRQCSVEVPHAELGAFQLHLNGSNIAQGTALNVLPIAVSSSAGEDDTGDAQLPFRNLAYALSFAKAGDTVELQAEGQFNLPSTVSGTACASSSNVDGLTIEGNNATIRNGTLIVAGTATIKNLTVFQTDHGVVARSGANLTLSNVTLTGDADTADTAVRACSNSTVRHSGTGSVVDGWIRGYIADPGSTLRLGKQNVIRNNVTGIYTNSATLIANTITLSNNTRYNVGSIKSGIYAAGSSTVSLTSVVMTSNGGLFTVNQTPDDGGLVLTDTATATVDKCTFDNSNAGGEGVVLRTKSQLTFAGGASDIVHGVNVYGYVDNRPGGEAKVSAATLRFNGEDFDGDIVGTATSPNNHWHIKNNNTLHLE